MDVSRRGNDDRGVAMLLFAFAVVAIAAVSALVLGSSNGYAAVRSSQNAADAAATAATAALHQVYSEGASPSEVRSTAVDVAEDNGADQGSVTCEIVAAAYAVTNADADIIGPCDGTNETDPDAAGVRVTMAETRYVPLGYFVGDDEITANAAAAATMQPVREGSAPFMVCANAAGHPEPLLQSPDPPWEINDAAVGTSVVLWGHPIRNEGRDCGHGAESWRGLVAFDESFPIPSPDPDDDTHWWQIETGGSSGHVPDLVAGPNSCGDGSGDEDVLDLIDCRLVLPLCTQGNGLTGDSFRLHCVRLGAFQISFNSRTSSDSGQPPCVPPDEDADVDNTICADFLGGAVASDGESVAATPLPDEVVAIRLVE